MGLALLGVVLAVAGLVLFATRRSRFRGRLPSSTVGYDRAAAIDQAARHVRDLTGVDVDGWPAFAVPSSDPALLQQAHQLGVMDQAAPVLLRWGLLYGWRVRFCGPHDNITVGLGGTGAVHHLQVAGRRRNAVTALGAPTPPVDLPPSISPDGAARVAVQARHAAAPSAASAVSTDPAARQGSTTFAEDGDTVKVEVTVESWGDRIVAVTTKAMITADGLDAVRRADRRGRRFQRAAMAAMVLALLAGGLVLLVGRHAPPLLWPVVLGLVAFGSVMVGEPQMFPRMVVYEFDGKEPLAACRKRHIRQTMVAAGVNGAFVTAGLAVGDGLLAAAGAPAAPPLLVQVAVGVVVGCAWLGLTSTAFSLLAARGRLAATAELAPAALRRLGYSWREVIGASLQSSIGEEVLYRLVVVSLAWHLVGQPWPGVVVSAALWSATHDVGDVRPRKTRSLELWALGCVLGLVLIFAGLAAAVTAHLVFNLLLLGWPLLVSRGEDVEAALP